MREDMKRVIINTGRREERWCRKNGLSRTARARERVLLERDPDLLPRKEGFARWQRGGSRYPGDRLSPLHRWVAKQVGRRWDDVWSEICATNDARSIDGWHLRGHAKEGIRFPSDAVRFPWYRPPLRVDEDGILRRNSARHSWRTSDAPQTPRPFTPTEKLFVLESGRCQYWRLEGLWYAFEWDDSAELHVWDPIRRARLLERLPAADPRRWRKRRLSNADVERLRLVERARRPPQPRRRGGC